MTVSLTPAQIEQLLAEADERFGMDLRHQWLQGLLSLDQVSALLPYINSGTYAQLMAADAVFSTELMRGDFPGGVTPADSNVQPTNPFSVYNIQDRWRDGVFRYNTGKEGALNRATLQWVRATYAAGRVVDLGALEAAIGPNHRGVTQYQRIYGWRYEARSSIMQSHFYATAAWYGLGTTLGSHSDLGSADPHDRMQAEAALTRQIITATVYTASLIGTGLRFTQDVRLGDLEYAAGNPRNDHAKDMILARSVISATGLSVLALSNVVGLGFAIMKLDDAVKADDEEEGYKYEVAQASLGVAQQALFLATNFSKAVGGFTAIRASIAAQIAEAKVIQDAYLQRAKYWNIAGTAFGIAQSTVSLVSTALLFATPGLTEEEKIIIGVELSTQAAGSAIQAVSSAVLASRIVSGASLAGPVMGAAVGGMLLALSPIQIYGLIKQSEYADKLDELGAQLRQYGYDGDASLADLYRDKTETERNYLIATTVLATVGTAVSVAAACSVVGAPVAAIVTLVTSVVGAMLPLIQTAELEKLANDFARKIDAQGGSWAFFDRSITANYAQMLAGSNLQGYLTNIQDHFGVDSVVGVTSVPISKTALELAAFTKKADDMRTAQILVDRFRNGQVVADRTVDISPAAGTIDLGGAAGTLQLLTFLTPLMAPGSETRTRVSTGKNSYSTTLEILFPADQRHPVWTIRDGAASSVMDVRNVVTSIIPDENHLEVGSLQPVRIDVGLHIDGGEGDDSLIANAGSEITFDGGAGHDAVSYASLEHGGGIKLSWSDGGFTVDKGVRVAVMYQEIISEQTSTYGKRSESVEYRDVELTTNMVSTDDRLLNVEEITGTAFDDTLHGSASGDVFHGGAGNDLLKGHAGDDLLDGGDGSDTLVGGDGVDTADFSSLVGRGVTVDMGIDAVDPEDVYPEDISYAVANPATGGSAGTDVLFEIENLRGTEQSDHFTGDAGRNLLWGMGGNDTLNGGDGNDVLAGGTGINRLDGGAGVDLATYADYAFGVWVSLQNDNRALYSDANSVYAAGEQVGVRGWHSGTSVLYGEGYDYDTLAGIENIQGSGGCDFIEGNEGRNEFAGGAGDDQLIGAGGDDVLSAGAGIDVLDGGAGIDIADLADDTRGGLIVDFEQFGSIAPGPIYFSAATNTPYIVVNNLASYGYAGTVRAYLRDIEHLFATASGDWVGGNGAANQFAGGDGDDTLLGRGGDDTLAGGVGNDAVIGGTGDDTVIQTVRFIPTGGVGAGTDADGLQGGEGFDVLDYSDSAASGPRSSQEGIHADMAAQLVVKDRANAYWNDWVVDFEAIIGTTLNDTLLGDSAENVLVGMAGDDLVDGRDGDDTLSGNEGQDTLRGGEGTDFISGGNGADELQGGNGDDLLRSGEGNDTLDGGDGSDTADYYDHPLDPDGGIRAMLYQGIVYESRNQNGFCAPDRFDIVTGIENVRGTRNSDSLFGNAQANQLYAMDGDDRLFGQEGDDWLEGGAGSDLEQGDAGNDVFAQGLGLEDDTLDGGDGSDVVDYSGTPALGTRRFQNGSTTVTTAQGLQADLAEGRIRKYTVTFASGPQGVDLVSGIESVVGTGLNDTLLGDGQANGLVGAAGDDVIDGRDGYDVLKGEAGNDSIAGASGNDTLYGDDGRDTLVGGAGNDEIFQRIERFDESIDGGDGIDTLDYGVDSFPDDERGDGMGRKGIVADLALGTVEKFAGAAVPAGGAAGVDRVSGIEVLVGSYVDDELRGTDQADGLSGLDGNDLIEGRRGNDTLGGGSGSDTLRGGAGDDEIIQDVQAVSDVLEGGSGIDHVSYDLGLEHSLERSDNGSAVHQGIDADLEAGSVNKYFGGTAIGVDRLLSIEDINATVLDDRVLGSRKGNYIAAGWGNDFVDGRGGRDSLEGGLGDDTLLGGAGDDTINGGGGSDVVDGGDGDDVLVQHLERGNDTLRGGLGRDRLDYSLSTLNGARADGLGTQGIVADLYTTHTVRKFAGQDADGSGVDSVVDVEDLVGTAVNDSITGSDADNALFAQAGDDFVNGLSGHDAIDGGAGNDDLWGGAGDDTIAGGSGSDVMHGGSGADLYRYVAGDGADVIDDGFSNEDALQFISAPGGAALDALSLWFQRSGDDLVIKVIGSPGDQLTVRRWFVDSAYRLGSFRSADGWLLDAASVDPLVLAMQTMDMPASPLEVSLSVRTTRDMAWRRSNDAALLITGGAGGEVLAGGSMDDEIEGGAGNDRLSGGSGDDVFHQSVDFGDVDVLDGSDGIDTVSYDETVHPTGARGDGSTQGVHVDLATGQAVKQAGAQIEYLVHIENVTGSDLDDTLKGSESGELLAGDAGRDTLVGRGGDDVLVGGMGHDSLDGGAGLDVLVGGQGDDLLEGGTGDDSYRFVRGAGNDRLREVADTAGGGMDVLTFAINDDGEALTPMDLWFSRVGNDLRIDVIDEEDSITIEGWFGSAPARVETFLASDGRSLAAADVDALIAEMGGPVPALVQDLPDRVRTAIDAKWQARNLRPLGQVGFQGSLREGSTLTASHNLVDPDGMPPTVHWQWQSALPGSNAWTDVVGANASTWVVDGSAADRNVRVLVSYTDGRGTLEQVASGPSTTTVLAGNQNHTGHVVVVGQAVAPGVLKAWFDLADPDGGMFNMTYQWQSSSDGLQWTNAAGGTGSYFNPPTAMAGQMIRVVVSFVDQAGWVETEASAGFGPLATGGSGANGTGTVTLGSGTQVGQYLAASVTASDPDGIVGAVRLVWQRYDSGANSWANLDGLSGDSLPLTASLAGQTLRAVASFVDTLGKWTVIWSASRKVLPTGDLSWTANGPLQQGVTLTLANTIADPSAAYRWQSSADGQGGWTDIAGATATTFTLQQGQVGRFVRVRAVYADVVAEVVSPASTAPVLDDVPLGSVVVYGAARQGQSLQVAHNLRDIDGFSSSVPWQYQWQVSRDGLAWTSVSGATGSSFTPAADHVGQVARVQVNYLDGAGVWNAVTSGSSDRVQVDQAPVATGSVPDQKVVAGQAFRYTLPSGLLVDPDGDALSFSVSRADGTPLPAWLHFDAATRVLSGTPAAADAAALSLRVSATDGAGLAASLNMALNVVQPTWTGTALADSFTGNQAANVMLGLGGNDTLSSPSLAADSFVGGTGNDTLNGSDGADTYFFARGDGQDVIYESDVTVSGGTLYRDRLVFGPDIDASQLWFRKVNDIDLEISVIGTSDKVTVKAWFGSPATSLNDPWPTYPNAIDVIQDGSGRTLSSKHVDVLVNAMAALAPPPAGQTSLPGATQSALAPALAMWDSNDLLPAGQAPQRGRYLRIYHTDSRANLSLTELQVWSHGINVAAGLSASVGADSGTWSSTYHSSTALTDGLSAGADSAWNGRQGALSNLAWVSGNGSEYIELDLGQEVDVDSISLYGRSDGANLVEAQNLRLLVGTAPLVGSLATLSADPAVWRIDTAGPASPAMPAVLSSAPTGGHYDGGMGVDTIDYSKSLVSTRGALVKGVLVDLMAGSADAWWSGTASGVVDTLAGIENAIGTAQADRLWGGIGANLLMGQDGNDTLAGHGGADTLMGGSGSDLLQDAEAPVRGRYLRIYHTDATNTISLTELQVWSNGVNVALGKAMTAGSDSGSFNSTYHSSGAATDGQGLGAAWNGLSGSACNLGWVSVGAGDKGYLQIDLGQVVDIDSLVVFNRSDNSLRETQNLRFVVSQDAPSGNYASLSASAAVARIDSAGPATAGSSATAINPPQADRFDGGAGVDTLDYGASLVAERAALGKGVRIDLSGATANDKWWSSAGASGIADVVTGIENLTGTAQNDRLMGDANANVLVGGAGDDTVKGGLGNDTLDGGAGIDTADFSDAPVGDGNGIQVLMGSNRVNTGRYANGVNAANVYDVIYGIENIIGTRNNDALWADGAANALDGSDGADFISGGGGDDALSGGNDADTLDGGAGNDTLSGGGGSDSLNGGEGNDLLQDAETPMRGRYLRIYHTDTTNTISLTELQVWSRGVNVALGKAMTAGSDSGSFNSIYHSSSAATDGQGLGAAWNGLSGSACNLGWVSVGAGDKGYLQIDLGQVVDIDSLVVFNRGDNPSATLKETQNLRFVVSQDAPSGNYAALSADAGVMRVDTAGPAVMGSAATAGSSATAINPPQADRFDGGAGVDTLDYGASLVAERAALGKGVRIDLSGATANDKWWSSASASGIADVVTGIENLIGTAQNDRLMGDANANVLVGGAGDDIVKGGLGNDTLDGGAGIDTADFSDAPVGDGNGIQVLMGSNRVNTGRYANGVNAANVYDVIYGIENIIGTRNNDALWADGAANALDGSDGADFISGGGGDDALSGGNDADTLDGGAGNDRLNGGAGNDALNGGAGSDAYRFEAGDGVDVIQESDTATPAGKDILRFVGGTQDAALWFSRVGNDLQVKRVGSTDQVTVTDWFVDGTHQVERFVASYGRTLTNANVAALVSAMAGAPPAQPQNVPAGALSAIQSLWQWSVGISGTVAENQVLTASVTDTDIVTGAVAWKWQSAAAGTAVDSADWTDVAGQTGSTLTLTHALAGQSLRAVATYTNPFGDVGTALSAATERLIVPNNHGSVVIGGSVVRQHDQLTANVSDPEGVADVVRYVWQSAPVGTSPTGNWQDIAGATGRTFTLTQQEVGRSVRLVAYYHDQQGTLERATSAPSTAVQNVNDAPAVSMAPAKQVAVIGNAFTYVLPTTAFKDPDPGDALSFAATQAGGLPMPSWLSFDPMTRQFSGMPPSTEGTITVNVTASDPLGLQASLAFDIQVVAPTHLGTAGNDTLSNSSGSMPGVMLGLAGDDMFYSYADGATLAGGTGNDFVRQYFGAARYQFSRGDGADVLDLGQPLEVSSGVSTLVFDKTVVADQLWLTEANNQDLIVNILGTTDAVQVRSHFSYENSASSYWHGLDAIQAGDGRVLARNQIDNLVAAMNNVLPPPPGQLTLPTGYPPSLYAAWQAAWSGGVGDDVLQSGVGQQSLHGEQGNDLLRDAEVHRAQYLRIYHQIWSGVPISLTELEVMSSGQNVAAAAGVTVRVGADSGRPFDATYFSSTALVDGSKGGAWNGSAGQNSNLAWVGPDNSQWADTYIEIDLGQVRDIDSIVLYGRSDAINESKDLQIFGSATPMAGTAKQALYQRDDVLDESGVGYWMTPGPSQSFVSWARPKADTLDGGAGEDTVDYSDSLVVQRASLNQGVNVDLNAGTADKWASGANDTDTLISIENVVGTAQGDTIAGHADANRLDGLGGNDTLRGDAGDDVLTGGAGNDSLVGGTGGDRYVFAAGHGMDTIAETGTDMDRMSFASNAEQIWFRRSGQDLLVSAIGTSDQVTVQNWYLGPEAQVEVIEAADGKYLTHTQVDALVAAMAALAPPAAGQTTLPPPYQTQLAPALAAWSGG